MPVVPYLATDALATAYSGTAEHLHAPVIVRSRSMAEELILEPSVAEPLARAAAADAAFVGIGGIKDRADLGWAADVSRSEWAELVAAGMVGDIAGRFFDRAGKLIDHEINHRVIGLTLDQIRRHPHPRRRGGRAGEGRALAGGHATPPAQRPDHRREHGEGSLAGIRPGQLKEKR